MPAIEQQAGLAGCCLAPARAKPDTALAAKAEAEPAPPPNPIAASVAHNMTRLSSFWTVRPILLRLDYCPKSVVYGDSCWRECRD